MLTFGPSKPPRPTSFVYNQRGLFHSWAPAESRLALFVVDNSVEMADPGPDAGSQLWRRPAAPKHR